jgi:hypothetical protein
LVVEKAQSFGSDFVLKKAVLRRWRSRWFRRSLFFVPLWHIASTVLSRPLSLFLDRPVRHARSMGRRRQQKGDEKLMPRFTIMHIYDVFAKNQYEATDELMRARAGKYDKVYLKKVLVKDAEEL